ncbi:MAG: anthranilate phosphoribosyltransferase [Deltaproteobacteria bacterium]|nr:anthranilate phosphoribosyltransferase [Deltaproteobacteria bacterium]
MIRKHIEKLCSRENLSSDEVSTVFQTLIAGELCDVQLSAFLIAMKTKGEKAEEIAGAVRALLDVAAPFPSPEGMFVDTCGTGGDGQGTVNISTAVAFVAAAAGVVVAKHGNRAVSSKSGSADVLEACGAKLEISPEKSRAVLDATGFCFLYAPTYHSSLRHAAPVRKALGLRTLLNLIGPLVNPARPSGQVMGVYDPGLLNIAAETLGLLGCKRAMVVHGGGLDELALHAETEVAFLNDGKVERQVIRPEDVDLARAPIEALAGGDPTENAAWLERALAGDAPEAHLDAIALNTGAVLFVAERSSSLKEGVLLAKETLLAGSAAEKLRHYVEASNA